MVSTYEIKKGTQVASNLEFTNKYETPKVPVTPKTGDSTVNMMLMFGMLAVFVTVMLLAIGYKKQLR